MSAKKTWKGKKILIFLKIENQKFCHMQELQSVYKKNVINI